MISTHRKPDPRGEALGSLALFCRTILPGVLRRIAAWKGLSLARVSDQRDDIAQELAVDCLANAETVQALTRAQRHTRWMRLAERWVYRQFVRPARRETDRGVEQLPAAEPRAVRPTAQVAPHIVVLKNGRCSLTATARRLDCGIAGARRELRALADRLGLEATEKTHWRRRLAEALTGLAADLLRLRGRLHCLPDGHPPPDPERRLRRIRRLAPRFAFHRTETSTRRIMARWKRVRCPDSIRPRTALEHAATLTPNRPEVWLWLFEAAIDEGDLDLAGRALLGCRRCADRPRGRLTLARARLLEVRGRRGGALALLCRARHRRPADPWIRRALEAVAGGAREPRPVQPAPP